MKIKMSKGRNIVSSFSYPEEFEAVMRELHILAAREGKEKSELLREIILEYVQAHSKGNSTFTLDTWQDDPGFQAVPTILAPKDKWNEYIKQCNDQELTKLSIQSIHITEFISHTRTQRKLKK